MKKLGQLILLGSCLFGMLLTSCSGGKKPTSESEVSSSEVDDRIYAIYKLYLADGGTLTYEEWLETIKGADGKDGKDGEDGEDGENGLSLLNGETDPDNSLGVNGETYINTSTWDIFVKVNGIWRKVGNIKGTCGNTVINGHGVPSTDIGIDGDSFIDLDTWDYYLKENGSWVLKGNIRGTNGNDGISVVSTIIDENGDLIVTLSDGTTINAGHVKDVEEYSVVFMSDGVVYKTETIIAGHTLNKPDDPTKPGHVFEGWYTKDGEKWIFGCYAITQNTILYARYTTLEYTITFDPNGGTCDYSSMIVTYGEDITLPVPERVFMEFSGWYADDVLVENGPFLFDHDVNLVAAWNDPYGFDEGLIIEDAIYSQLNGRGYKKMYRGMLSSGPGSLNYIKERTSFNSTATMHITNFIDGLVVENQYGELQLNLAESMTHNANYTEFSFKIRDDDAFCWVKSNGEVYEYNGVPQKVCAEDFITTPKYVCNYDTSSDDSYLLTYYIEGAAEYYLYTHFIKEVQLGNLSMSKLVSRLNTYMASWFPGVWEASYGNGKYPITNEDLDSIADFSRFGIKVSGDTVTYKLVEPMYAFPSMLTNLCYMPLNQNFINNVGVLNFGTSKDHFLYNGPYTLVDWTDNVIRYKRNELYSQRLDMRNYLKVNVEAVNYEIITDYSSFTSSTLREKFEAGNIDGFGLSKSDSEGWTQYITGLNGEGSLQNPVNSHVNARFDESIGSMYGSNLVLDRDKVNGGLTSYYSQGTTESVTNTARALRLADVRRAILDSIDMNLLFDTKYGDSYEGELRQQEKVWTYVPKGFAFDNDGNDYLTHYYNEYAAKKGIEAGDINNPQPGTAAYELRPGQTGTKTINQDGVNALLDKALEAIDLFNAENPDETITKPINLELYSLRFDETSRIGEDKIIASLNERLNGGENGDEKYKNLFNVVPTDNLTSANYNAVSRSGNWDLALIQWGWGADYTDPHSFLDTYTKNGGWLDVFKYIGEETVDNYEINDDETGLVKSDLLAEYTAAVDRANQETESLSRRYDYFAEAEYMLIEELGIYKPQTNSGQGWMASVSRFAGYENTKSSSVTSSRLAGAYVLTQVLTREERSAISMQVEQMRADYTSGTQYDIYN